MPGTFDKLLMLRTTGTLTASESVGPITIYGGNPEGLAARVIVPSAFGANDTILPKVYTSTDGSTYNLVAQNAAAVKPGSAGTELIVPFTPPAGKTYVKVELVVTIASTTANLGTTIVGLVNNPGFATDRSSGSQFR
jgi:hypothetical protein